MTFTKPSKKSITKNSAKAAQQTIQLVTYKDPGSGIQFSYKKGWHIKTVSSSSPSGTVVYLAPNTITTDSDAQKHASSPELVFYFYNSNPSPGHDTTPIAPPLKKLGELTLKNNVVATVETQNTSQGKTVTLSACRNALCIFKVNNRYIKPMIQTLGTVSGTSPHDVDETSTNYQAELRIWQSILY